MAFFRSVDASPIKIALHSAARIVRQADDIGEGQSGASRQTTVRNATHVPGAAIEGAYALYVPYYDHPSPWAPRPILALAFTLMKVSFSLASSKAKAASKPVGETPSLKRSAAFASLDDDDPVDASPTASSNSSVAANKRMVAQNLELSKTQRKRMEQEMKVDASVFEYDEVWDKMQNAKQKQKEAKEVDAKERKVRIYSSD